MFKRVSLAVPLKGARFDLKKRFRLKIQELEIFKRSLEITLTEDYLSL